MQYKDIIIVRTGISHVNWENTSDCNVWGLPQTVKENTIKRINNRIQRRKGVIVMFLQPKVKKVEGRLVAMCIVKKTIQPINENDPSDQAMNWVAYGSNMLGAPIYHSFRWRMEIGDILYLEQSPEVQRTALIAHNGLDVTKKPKNLTRQSVHFPKADLYDYLLGLYRSKWGL